MAQCQEGGVQFLDRHGFVAASVPKAHGPAQPLALLPGSVSAAPADMPTALTLGRVIYFFDS